MLGHRIQLTTLLSLLAIISNVDAAFVDFGNCLSERFQNSRLLQFKPLNISAVFNTNGTSHLLNVTIYGNVSGQIYSGDYPPANDPSWNEPNSTFGKIVDVEQDADKATTLFTSYNVLGYSVYNAPASRFCYSTVNEACPLAPAFNRNSSDILDLPGYTVAYDLGSSYAFSTLIISTEIQSGGADDRYYGCVNAYITPFFGSQLNALLTWLPAAILIVVGVATVFAAMKSPWSSADIFHWSSNYGRDEDVLRLVTPGFGDCLQYLQFIVLTGSLSLQYPGFYQPAVSNLGWSSLLFNESYVTGGNGSWPVKDGIYQYRPDSNHGLDRTTQLIGMHSQLDAWADMMLWLVVIVICAIIVTQIGFLIQWIYRQIKDDQPEDLRSKNWYFSVGNVVRITMGYFLLPLMSLSMYQFVIGGLGPIFAVALAAVVVALIIAFTSWLTWLFVKVRPRSFLFDDLQTVLLYGPLYNTYRDETATFALVPILINILRGIAVGAVQTSGVAQLVLLAISEVVFILTINAVRPYAIATSMNLYHTCFSAIRLLTILLAIAFVPSLSVTAATRGWIGYVILLIHACVLVFGFFLNALQTLVEMIARLAGAGATGGRDHARGGLVKVFGMRQLSRRMPRRDVAGRTSQGSNAQMLATQDEKNEIMISRTRSRSISASSNLLLDADRQKHNSQMKTPANHGQHNSDGLSTISKLSKNLAGTGAIVGLAKTESRDPYYRPPRRNTNDFMTASGRPRLSGQEQRDSATLEQAVTDVGEGPSNPKAERDDFDDTPAELTKSKTDYAVREVDFYYGVRGEPLSGSGGTRRLRTGPADPTGPVSSARGWFKGIMGGKTKEKGKGFEVVRSAKAPPGTFPPPVEATQQQPTSYQDGPVLIEPPSKPDDAVSFSTNDDDYGSPIPRAPTRPPMLPALDNMSGIELPSRINSEASRKRPMPIDEEIPMVPPVPRKSSRRGSSPASTPNIIQQPPATVAPLQSSERGNSTLSVLTSTSQRIPFANIDTNRQEKRKSAAVSTVSSYMEEPMLSGDVDAIALPNVERPSSVGYVSQHRASDSIRYSPDEAHVPHLSAVEYGNTEIQHENPSAPWTPSWNGSSAYNDGSPRRSRFRD